MEDPVVPSSKDLWLENFCLALFPRFTQKAGLMDSVSVAFYGQKAAWMLPLQAFGMKSLTSLSCYCILCVGSCNPIGCRDFNAIDTKTAIYSPATEEGPHSWKLS